jgi:hypothetical protein
MANAQLEPNTTKFFDDLEAIRLSPEDMADFGAREILTRIPVRRPKRREFVRCHPDSAMTLAVPLFVDEDDGEAYYVTPNMRSVLADEVKPTLLQLSMFKPNTPFIWPLTLPSEDNSRGRSWHESALKAREVAKSQWVRLVADRTLGGYRVFAAEGKLSEPGWPMDKTFNELLEVAFDGRVITSEDHPLVRKLRGQV